MITSPEQDADQSVRRRSDRSLIAACRNGDEEAWSALLDKYKNLIFSIPIKQGLSQTDARDIFQAVWLELLTELPRLRNPDGLPKWLIQTTARKCWRWKRQEARFSIHDDGEIEALELEAPPQDNPEQMFEDLQSDQLLRQIVNDLPPRCRRMIQLLFYETPARPYADVAAMLGVATGSIGFLRLRCLRRLRRELERSGFERGPGRIGRNASDAGR
jgi:RNA polymerase sigma factor (sigma-70 family)